jgi:alkanesulfonate monooxygenase SsuD/methylene tetrahydromethanopterin reductase-like flavin-dependent oxidoreductase (luciferase family)
MSERFERLEETLRICAQMWSPDDGPYDGKHYRLAETVCVPAPVRGKVPVLIGGSGERKTLRLVARYADACNLFDVQGSQFRDNIAHKLGVLRQHCAEAGRDFAAIEKTVATDFHLGEDPKTGAAALLAHLRELAAAGIDQALVTPGQAWDEAALDAVLAILPDVHAIETQVPR